MQAVAISKLKNICNKWDKREEGHEGNSVGIHTTCELIQQVISKGGVCKETITSLKSEIHQLKVRHTTTKLLRTIQKYVQYDILSPLLTLCKEYGERDSWLLDWFAASLCPETTKLWATQSTAESKLHLVQLLTGLDIQGTLFHQLLELLNSVEWPVELLHPLYSLPLLPYLLESLPPATHPSHPKVGADTALPLLTICEQFITCTTVVVRIILTLLHPAKQPELVAAFGNNSPPTVAMEV